MASARSSPPPGEEHAIETGDDFLSPRSKVAKMLADIDDAPTPSPPSRQPTPKTKPATGPFQHDSEDEDDEPAESETRQQLLPSHATGTKPADLNDSDDEDGAVRRPQGRAARKMLGLNEETEEQQSAGASESHNAGAESDEDLYSATPIRPSSLKRKHHALGRAASGSPLASQSQRSGGLFVSPTMTNAGASDRGEELPSNPLDGGSSKLANLVAQKRAERIAREKAEKEKTRQAGGKLSFDHSLSDLPEEAFERSQDAPQNPDVDRILSDAARPTRKASKKALLEMERETQRLARQQALAHQMKTKKKFSTNDLFAKFNFRQPQQAAPAHAQSSSAPNSDGTEVSPVGSIPREPVSTPPSSPPTPFDKQRMLVERGALAKMVPVREDSLQSLAAEQDDELPDLDAILKYSQAQKQQTKVAEPESKKEAGSKIARWGKKAVPQTYRDDDSDDDLEVLEPLPRHLQVFDRVKPAKKAENHSKAIHALRHLSHIGQYDANPNRKGAKPAVRPQFVEAQLIRRAKEQARQAQQERMEELKAKGIVMQTAEEREKEAEEFENLLERARQEAQDLKKAEKAARKKAGGEENMEASDDESEDGDYMGSGSEEDAEAEPEGNDMVDDVADESEDEEVEAESEPELMEEAEELGREDVPVGAMPFLTVDQPTEEASQTPAQRKRMPRKSRVIEDDEDSDVSPEDLPATANVAAADEDPFAAFGFGGVNPGANLMSPTQAFNATMQMPTQDSQQNSLDTINRIAPLSGSVLPPTFRDMDLQTQAEDSQTQLPGDHRIPESQESELKWVTPPPETPAPGLARKTSGLSETPGWEPSQDPGLPSPWTAARRGQLQREPNLDSVAEDNYETQDTVQMRVSESPLQAPAPKRGRLVQRRRHAADDSDEDVAPVKPSKKDAFKEMKRRRLDNMDTSERAEAEAEMKRMMDEQAEESEDEYVGLGGDDTEMIAPESAEDQAMIDSSHIDVDERAIAAHYAERQRVAEEESTKKLYRDLTTGALRRRQGAAFDLDEDEDDLAVQRRQMRQREEARKRKLLLQDDNVKDWAEKGKHTKGKDAFLRAMADDDDNADEIIDLDDEEHSAVEPSTQEDSQATQQEANVPASQGASGNKRPAEDDGDSQSRPPAKQRRTKTSEAAMSRPTSMLQVRESLSFLLDEPAQEPRSPPLPDDDDEDYGSDFEDESSEPQQYQHHDSDDEEVAAEASRQNDGGFAPNPKEMEDKVKMPPPRLPALQRRTTAVPPAVVDRLSLKRGSSSSGSSDGSAGRSAWATGASSSFKAPSLLRRATTNTTSSGANDRGVSVGNNGGGGNARGVTIGGGGARGGNNKKSSLAYQARTEERRAIVEASARRKAENTRRIAEMRRASTGGLRGLGGGFE